MTTGPRPKKARNGNEPRRPTCRRPSLILPGSRRAFKLGQAAYYTGETSLALQSFENALSIDPNDGPARFNFAMSLVQGTYYADAAKELETFLQFDPNNIQAHLEAANLYAEKLYDVAKAAIHYKRVIGLNPEHPQAVNIRYWLIRNKAN